MLAAYYESITAEALSVELGVSMPYLEEEIEILEAAGVLKRTGDKYQTNIVIITDSIRSFESRIYQRLYFVNKEISSWESKHACTWRPRLDLWI